MRRWLPALALVTVLTGCASAGPSPGATPSGTEPSAVTSSPAGHAPRTISPADDGKTYALAVDATTTLRLTDADDPEPQVEGDAVLLIAVVNVAASGAREWEVRGAEPGTSLLSGMAAGAPWTITLVVTG